MQHTLQSAETGALIYWFDIRPEVVQDWLNWYLRDHMPSRVGSTFTTGRCFEAIDAPSSHMVLFETNSPEALLAPSYLQLLGTVSDDDRKRRGWYANTVRMTARVRTRLGAGVGSVLSVIRFDQSLHTVPQTLMSDIAGIPGVGSVWIAEHDPSIRSRMDSVRVTGHQDLSAAGALMTEASTDSDARLAVSTFKAKTALSGTPAPGSVTVGRYRLMYCMTA